MSVIHQSLANRDRFAALVGFSLIAALSMAACGSLERVPATQHSEHQMDVAPADARARLAAIGEPGVTVSSAEVQVRIENFRYSPATLTIPVGTTVIWTNADAEEHTVTSSTRAFSSAGLDQHETYAYRFDTPGSYAYFCALHPHMTAQIVVQ